MSIIIKSKHHVLFVLLSFIVFSNCSAMKGDDANSGRFSIRGLMASGGKLASAAFALLKPGNATDDAKSNAEEFDVEDAGASKHIGPLQSLRLGFRRRKRQILCLALGALALTGGAAGSFFAFGGRTSPAVDFSPAMASPPAIDPMNGLTPVTTTEKVHPLMIPNDYVIIGSPDPTSPSNCTVDCVVEIDYSRYRHYPHRVNPYAAGKRAWCKDADLCKALGTVFKFYHYKYAGGTCYHGHKKEVNNSSDPNSAPPSFPLLKEFTCAVPSGTLQPGDDEVFVLGFANTEKGTCSIDCVARKGNSWVFGELNHWIFICDGGSLTGKYTCLKIEPVHVHCLPHGPWSHDGCTCAQKSNPPNIQGPEGKQEADD